MKNASRADLSMERCGFSGSYDRADVIFLMKPAKPSSLAPTSIAEKEALLQAGGRHYSEMIGPEEPPDMAYLDLFKRALDRVIKRFAGDLASLTKALALEADGREVILVSLARAGTPIGVLLHRCLRTLGVSSHHYSISIIRDRGIDELAVGDILARHPKGHIVWVDGWTGKGSIARELRGAVARLNAQRGDRLEPRLVAVADPAGCARLAASGEDYLIPNAILNATVSGLISRSILNRQLVGPNDYHACIFYQEFHAQDLSRWFVEKVAAFSAPLLENATPSIWIAADRAARKASLKKLLACFGAYGQAFIKPGIGEATRALLRRTPERLVVRSASDPDLDHLYWLAARKNIEIEVHPDLEPPWRACSIIKPLERME